ncbi:MAG: MFS transporter [Acidobacteriaceae bacterium]
MTSTTRTGTQPPTDDALRAGLRRRWLYVLPAVFITYSLAYLDRANYSFGAAAGLAATLHITGEQTSRLAALFFLGYFLFQLPGARLARRYSSHRLVAISLVSWGALAALTGILRSFWMLAVVRFLLGTAESFIFPAMLLLLTHWFTRQERSRANAILTLGNPVTVLWMSAITGYLIQAVGWQRTFIYEGIPSILWAAVWLVFVRDRPSQASWLHPSSASDIEAQLALEQTSVPGAASIRIALLRPDVILLSIVYFTWSLGVYGFVMWLPTIVHQGSDLSMGRTGLLSAVPYALAIIMMLGVSYLSDRTQRRRDLIWPFLVAAGLGLLVSFSFASHSFVVAFLGLVIAGGCMYAPYGSFFAIIPERVPPTATAEAFACINSAGALGGFFGSYAVGWLQAATGNARAGYLLMSMALIASGLLLLRLPEPPQSQLLPGENL